MPLKDIHRLLGIFVTSPATMRDVLKNNEQLGGMGLDLTPEETGKIRKVLAEVGNPVGHPIEVVGIIATALISEFPDLNPPKRR